MKITGTDRDSKCMYCDSKAYGKSCPYGPQRLHVHVDDPRRCVWCGSTCTGTGCPYNPFGKIHQKGIAYNPIMVEALEDGIVQGLIMQKLAQPINETHAYKLGLIDEQGNAIREPDNLEERKALTGVDKYLIRVKNLMQEKLDILNISLYYENKEVDSIEDIEQLYPIELQCKDDIQECISKLTSVAEEYSSKGISTSKFEQMIIESLLNARKN